MGANKLLNSLNGRESFRTHDGAKSSCHPSHILWTLNYWGTNAAGESEGHAALFRSLDGGASWTSVRDVAVFNREPFVKATPVDSKHSTVWFSDGGCGLARATVTDGAPPTFSDWTASTIDHCDPGHLGFSSADGRTPVLLASDGGLHRTADGGASWTLAGAGTGGYAALEITEVTGQLHAGRWAFDLYFGTQDNNLWASPDSGSAGPPRFAAKGSS